MLAPHPRQQYAGSLWSAKLGAPVRPACGADKAARVSAGAPFASHRRIMGAAEIVAVITILPKFFDQVDSLRVQQSGDAYFVEPCLITEGAGQLGRILNRHVERNDQAVSGVHFSSPHEAISISPGLGTRVAFRRSAISQTWRSVSVCAA
jgi:hypothetical protein